MKTTKVRNNSYFLSDHIAYFCQQFYKTIFILQTTWLRTNDSVAESGIDNICIIAFHIFKTNMNLPRQVATLEGTWQALNCIWHDINS